MIIHSGFRLRRHAWATACLVATALAVASNRPTEYLDEQTGATVVVVHEPLVFAREHSGFGRDYVTLAATAVNQSGRISYLLVGYIWSVGPASGPKDVHLAAKKVALQADERLIALALQSRSALELGIGVPVHRPPVGAAASYIYVTDLETVQMLAESSHLSLQIEEQSASAHYQLFEDGRSALREFVRFARARF